MDEFDKEQSNNREYVLSMVKQDGKLLDLASERLQDDEEIVMEAVKQNPISLEFASSRLKDNAKIVNELKHFKISINGTRPIEEAIITSGGISVKEINPKTMESKLIKGLYFAGEIIDVDCLTGGYNLQVAWSTGYTAGIS